MSSDGTLTDTSSVNFGGVSVLDPTTQASLNNLYPELANFNTSPLYTVDPTTGLPISSAPTVPVQTSFFSSLASPAGTSTGVFLLIGAIAIGAMLLINPSSKKR